MVSIHKRNQFWTSLPIFILLMTFISIVTMSDEVDDFKVPLDKMQQGSVFYLDNGMEVILVQNHANPMIAAFTIVKTGSRNEDAATNGAAHFLEHLLFNGTKTRTQKQLYDEMDFYGGYNNAHTGPDYTNYMVLMPKEFIAQGMDIQADMLFNSTLPEEKFEKERGIVIEEIGRSADRPTYQVQNHFLRMFFAGTPYERPVLGTVSTISHLQREQVLEYYRTWYVPNNMTLMVIGDFSTPEMVALVKEKYGGYPTGQLPHPQTIQLIAPKSLRIIRANGMGKFPNDRVYLNIGYVLPPPTYEDFQALEMLTEFLGGKETSRLKTLFKQDRYVDWVNTISASIDFNRDFSTLQISAELPLDSDVERTVELITHAVKGMADEPLSEEKLESALVSHVTGEIYLQEKLHYYPMMKAPYLTAIGPSFLRDSIEKLSLVTPQAIQSVAKKYLSDHFPVVTVMSPSQTDSSVTIGQSPNLYHTETLANSLTVVVQENRDSHVIGINLLAKERALGEGKDRWGMTEILQRTLVLGGTEKHPDESLYQAFESIGAELKVHDNPYIPYDNYYNSPRFAYIRLKLINAFFDDGLTLLSEMARQPRLTESAFEQAKKEVIPLAVTNAQSTPRVAARLFYDNLFVENPGYGWSLGKAEQLESILLSDLQAFQRKFYNPTNLMLVVSGNQPIDGVMALVKQHFGGVWGESQWKPPTFTPQFAELGHTVREKIGKQQSYIYLANRFEAAETDRPALLVLRNLFSEKLAFNLREKQGLAYSISMHVQSYGELNWYRITMGTRPENLDLALEGIQQEIQSVRNTTFDEKAIQQAINAILGRFGMRRLDRVSHAYWVGMEVFDGNPPEADEQFFEQLKKVTMADVAHLKRQVFQHDDPLIVIVE